MVWKALITGGLIIVEPGSLAQVAIGIVVCLAHYVICANTQPLAEGLDDVLQQITSVQLLMSLLMALILKADDATKAVARY